MKKARIPVYRVFMLLALTLCLGTSLNFQASAVPQEKTLDAPVPYYIGTSTTSAALEISASGEAACWGHIDCYWGYTTDAAMRLQWQNSNGVWIDYHSWYTQGRAADFDETWSVPKGRTYRVKVVGDVFDEDGNWVEIVDVASGSVKY